MSQYRYAVVFLAGVLVSAMADLLGYLNSIK
jgi:hypothetical protein